MLRYAYNADIEKIYRQILIHISRTKYQRIIFREGPTADFVDFELLTITVGISCDHHLTSRNLLALAQENEARYQELANVIPKSMYVDDLLAGAHHMKSPHAILTNVASLLNSATHRISFKKID